MEKFDPIIHEDIQCQDVERYLMTGVSHIIGTGDTQAQNQCAVLLMDRVRQLGYEHVIDRNQRRNIGRAVQIGYYAKQFEYSNHVPDIVAIKTSMDERSGGKLKDHYKKTVEQSGGYPVRYTELPAPHCRIHQRNIFHGVFMPEQGYKQGTVVMDKRLVAFNGIAVCGEMAIYSWNIGHGMHLAAGVMALLTEAVVTYLVRDQPQVRYFVQGNWTDGRLKDGVNTLQRHKAQLGFEPLYLNRI